jgi:hypothetical protein
MTMHVLSIWNNCGGQMAFVALHARDVGSLGVKHVGAWSVPRVVIRHP